MERAEYSGGASRVCGSSAVHRVLNALGECLLGVQGVMDVPSNKPSSWWEDIDISGTADRKDPPRRASAHFQQTEFWRGEEQEPRAARVVAAPVMEKPATPEQEEAPVMLRPSLKGVNRVEFSVSGSVYAEKKKNMSMMHIARFLHISDSLYDGRDRGRWYNLPASGGVPYQLTNDVSASGHEGRTLRAVPRVFSGISRPRENGYLMK
ncbi:MAG: hypothetical protein V2A34_15755 [Lentisphaerota bacterium]